MGLAKRCGRVFRKILIDQRADESDRLVAAELAGDYTVINDDLAETLLTVVRSAGEPDQLRAKAAISLGPALEQAERDGFEDPDDVPITERTFRNIQVSLEKIYLDNSTPKEVRRRNFGSIGARPRELAPGCDQVCVFQWRQRVDADGCVFDALGSRF
jgi:hypothetical protein